MSLTKRAHQAGYVFSLDPHLCPPVSLGRPYRHSRRRSKPMSQFIRRRREFSEPSSPGLAADSGAFREAYPALS